MAIEIDLDTSQFNWNPAQDRTSAYSILGKCIDFLRLNDTSGALVVGCVRLKEKTRMVVYYPHDENRETIDILYQW